MRKLIYAWLAIWYFLAAIWCIVSRDVFGIKLWIAGMFFLATFVFATEAMRSPDE